jgi:WD40 repeat protein
MVCRRILPVFAAGLLFASSSLLAQQTADELRAENGIKKLNERFADDKADREKLRQDILTFRRVHAGTPQAVRAADMLRQLPSPLDRLSASKIRPLEVFDDWQPKELVAILGEHRGRQGGPATCVAYSPDKKLIASGGAHLVRLWDTDPKRLLRLIVNLGASNVACLAFSPDSKMLAAGSQGAIFLFDVDGKDTKLRVTIPAGSTWINSVAFDPKGKPLLACGSYDTKVRLFDLEQKDPKAMEIGLLAKHQQSVNSVAFSPDGAYVASGSSDGTVRLWKIDGAKTDEAAKIDANPKGVNSLAYTKDGRVLAAGSADGTILLWTMAGSKASSRANFPAHGSSAVSTLAFSPGGHTLTSGGADWIIRQWDATKKVPTKSAELKGHAGAISGVGYSPDGGTLVSGSGDWTVRLWDLAARRERVPPDGPLGRIAALAFSPDGATLANGGEDHFLRLWNMTGDAPKERHTLKGDDYPIYSLAYAPDGKSLAAGGYQGTIRLWNVADKSPPQSTGQIKDLPSYVYSLAYSPDGGRLLVHHYRTASLFDMKTRTRLHQFEADDKGSGINAIVLSPDGSRVAAASGYYLVKNGEFVKNKDGSFVYFDNFLRVWDTDVGKLLHKHPSPLPVSAVAFTPEGRQVITSAWDSILRTWDVPAQGPKEADTFKTGVSYFYRMQYSPDGRYLVTHGQDNRIVIWDVASKKKLHDWALPEYVGTEAFAPDSRHLALSLYTGVTYIIRLEGTGSHVAK